MTYNRLHCANTSKNSTTVLDPNHSSAPSLLTVPSLEALCLYSLLFLPFILALTYILTTPIIVALINVFNSWEWQSSLTQCLLDTHTHFDNRHIRKACFELQLFMCIVNKLHKQSASEHSSTASQSGQTEYYVMLVKKHSSGKWMYQF